MMGLLPDRLTVWRPDTQITGVFEDPYGEPNTDKPAGRTIIHQHLRAQISAAQGSETTTSGEQLVTTYKFDSEIADISHLDIVQREDTGDFFDVVAVQVRTGLSGKPHHLEGRLRQTAGVP